MSQSTTQPQNLEDLLKLVEGKSPKVEVLLPLKPKPPGVVGVFGVFALPAALMFYNMNQATVKYVATTKSVLTNPKFKLAKEVTDYLVQKGLKLIELPDEINRDTIKLVITTFSNIFDSYSMHVTGMPTDLAFVISVVSMGQKWLYKPEKDTYLIL